MSKQYDMESDKHYLQLLSQSFPTVADASTEIINLQAILNLPKGTEHFLADLHGEYEAFQHVLKNASGNIKRKVNELFGTTLRDSEKRELCTLIYYPEQKLELVKDSEPDIDDWYHITLHHLVAVCRDVSSKYTRSKVRKSLPADFSYIIQELLHERTDDNDKAAYVNVIVDTIISTGRADDFIIAISHVIQRLVSKERFYAGCQPRCPSEHLYRRRKFKSPARTHRISLVRARYPSEYLYVLVLILPSRSTAFTCRYTELLAHSYYTRSRAISNPF